MTSLHERKETLSIYHSIYHTPQLVLILHCSDLSSWLQSVAIPAHVNVAYTFLGETKLNCNPVSLTI